MTASETWRAARQRYYRVFARAHNALMLRTGGRPERLGWRMRCLVLETTGRRSGEARRVVLLYMPDGDGCVVVASNFGGERPPAWWVNLQASPEAWVERRGRRVRVYARELHGDERTATLAKAMAYNKQWRGYASTVQRPLPIVRLEPVA
jgi:deazaflavin-dependent oxidoreductase (nitroreductase family)